MGNYKVYMHKTPSNKVYIGITKNNPKKRWNSGKGYKGNPHFTSAIKKYGWDNIQHIILFDNLEELEAKMIEVDLVYYYKKQGMCYNITDGGDGANGVSLSKETKKKMSLANKGRKRSQETKMKISDARKGLQFTDEHKKNLSTAHKGQGNKSIVKMDEFGNILEQYDSIKGAAIANNINYSTLKNRIGKERLILGIKWRYA